MRPSAKALYPVMRYFGYFSIDDYAELEYGEPCDEDFKEVYPYREFDFCEAEIGILAKYAGIHRNSIKSALKNGLMANTFSLNLA